MTPHKKNRSNVSLRTFFGVGPVYQGTYLSGGDHGRHRNSSTLYFLFNLVFSIGEYISRSDFKVCGTDWVFIFHWCRSPFTYIYIFLEFQFQIFKLYLKVLLKNSNKKLKNKNSGTSSVRLYITLFHFVNYFFP